MLLGYIQILLTYLKCIAERSSDLTPITISDARLDAFFLTDFRNNTHISRSNRIKFLDSNQDKE